jgi:hypothetical protein
VPHLFGRDSFLFTHFFTKLSLYIKNGEIFTESLAQKRNIRFVSLSHSLKPIFFFCNLMKEQDRN